MPIMTPVSWGELLDKITILEIKRQRITDLTKQANVERELAALNAVVTASGNLPEDAQPIIDQLRHVNETLWDIEDEIRECERSKNFGARFIELARAVYHTNDKRAAFKRDLNDLLGSELIEEKSYQPY
ncbi:hypothetical protein [Azospirillum sp.]|uniref:hypothetical protein n=1 Tax=Azospirillum sp. TaxID=34012 RepID=UPI00263796CE|nr:hypothetical protein [Azospirillum sp.]